MIVTDRRYTVAIQGTDRPLRVNLSSQTAKICILQTHDERQKDRNLNNTQISGHKRSDPQIALLTAQIASAKRHLSQLTNYDYMTPFTDFSISQNT